MQRIRRIVAVVGLAFAAGPLVLGQSAAADGNAKLPEFEVVSIRPLAPGEASAGNVNVLPGGKILIPGTTLKQLVVLAFHVGYWQIKGGDPWMNDALFRIEAEPPAGTYNLRHSFFFGIQDENLRLMMQAMLADRFHLTFHLESKTGTIYILEKSGRPSQLKPTIADTDRAPKEMRSGYGDVGWAGTWNMYNASIPQLASFASNFVLHVPVVDKTGLGGVYDFRSKTPPSEDEDVDHVSSFFYFMEEMGLRLRKSTGHVETFVIDHAERPEEN